MIFFFFFLFTLQLDLTEASYNCTPLTEIRKSFFFPNVGVGTCLGGWLVLEPWLTPSLFYQFLGVSERYGDDARYHVGMDSHSFCTALGPQEANRQLRRHWKTWVNSTFIAKLSKAGVNTLRIPVGDWMYEPYHPYVDCWAGSFDELDRVLKLLKKYNMKAIIDVHAVKDSANGLDNGGKSIDVSWLSNKSSAGFAKFDHWNVRAANWIGKFNLTTKNYDSINYENIQHSLKVVEKIIRMYRNNSVVIGIETVNEPWQHTPLAILKEFYWEGYQKVQNLAPHWIFLFHDSFDPSVKAWGDFLFGCPNYAIDSHIYQAWAPQDSIATFVDQTCNDALRLRELRDAGLPFIIGEWSLATDNCAMWLNGFNDNCDGYPMWPCSRIVCPDPYMGSEQPGAPPDPTKGPQDPFGTGESFVINGSCPIDFIFPNEDESMKTLALAKLYAYSFTGGHFYWNFRTELAYRWNFQEVINRGWMSMNLSDAELSLKIETICKNNPSALPTFLSDVNHFDHNNFFKEIIFGSNDAHSIRLLRLIVLAFLFVMLCWCVSVCWNHGSTFCCLENHSSDNFPYTVIEDHNSDSDLDIN